MKTDTGIFTEGQEFECPLAQVTHLTSAQIKILRVRDVDESLAARFVTAGTKSMLAADRMEVARFNRGKRW